VGWNTENLQSKADHASGGFEWEMAPSCSSGLLTSAIEERGIFVSNLTERGHNLCYVFLLTMKATCIGKMEPVSRTVHGV
jgi:hypothetical protein